jgi:hypothetical protein
MKDRIYDLLTCPIVIEVKERSNGPGLILPDPTCLPAIGF